MSSRRSRAVVALVREIYLEGERKMFEFLEEQDPEIAALLKPAFEEYMEVALEVMNNDPDGNTSINDVKRRIPHNAWISVMQASLAKSKVLKNKSAPDKKKVREFRKEVNARAKRKDIH
jgi:hypothetical protein